MRLSTYEVSTIKNIVEQLDHSAEVYLFGSRVHDDKKGGDIDLFIKSHHLVQKDAWKIKEEIWRVLGEQKIDIVIESHETTPFLKVALKEKIKL